MKRYEPTSRITLYATRAAAFVMAAMLMCFPFLVEQYHLHFRPLLESERIAIIAAFYCCGIPVLLALWRMDQLLHNILGQKLFTAENVGHIRTVCRCCFAVSLICLGAAFGFPSLLFLAVIMMFLALVVRVVVSVMTAAVEIREENDLTI